MSAAISAPAVMRTKHPSSAFSRAAWWVREAIAAGLWLFFAVKLLIYDVDLVIIESLPPGAAVLLKYKFFFLLGLTAVLWLVLGNRRFATAVIYVFFYPVVLLLWRMPKLLLKNWIVLLVFSPAIHSLITGFRMNFVVASFGILAALAIVISRDPIFITAGMLFLVVYYCRHIYRKFKMAFQPASVFANVAGLLRQFWSAYQTKILPDQVKAESQLDPKSEAFRAKTIENLNGLYMVNSVLLIIAERLKQAAISRKLDIYFIVSVLFTALVTVIVFAFEYLGLEKVRPGSFSGMSGAGFWDFLGFSFNTLMTGGLSPLIPKGAIAQVLSHCELIAALLLLVIVVFVVLTSIRERYREDVEITISELKKGAELIEGHIQQQYKLTIIDVELKALVQHRPVVNYFRRCRGLQEIQAEVVSQTSKPESKTESTEISKPQVGQPG